MQPRDLNARDFRSYGPLARKTAEDRLELLRDLPVVLAAVLLRDVIRLDTSFPRERAAVENRLAFLAGLPVEERHRLTQGFAELNLPAALVAEDWVRSPSKFEEDLSAYLWASHQIDGFHRTSEQFVDAVHRAMPAATPAAPRWTAVVLGAELRKDGYPLFRKLAGQGVLFQQVTGADGMQTLLEYLAARAEKTPAPYEHWYVDGGAPREVRSDAVKRFSWAESAAMREAVLRQVETVIGSGSAGPEMLRSRMATWTPKDPARASNDALVDRFVLSVYGEGAGTQIFSTTFAQWSARELLRRAEATSLLVRFGPRQKQRGMNEMFAGGAAEMDYAGSLVDADFGAYYTWINQSRLAGAESARFLAWCERTGQAVAIGPGLPKGTQAAQPIAMDGLLKLLA